MTEKAQTPKLDVKTLEYVLSLGEKRAKQYDNFISAYAKEGNKQIVEKLTNKRIATRAFLGDIRDLIYEQQEA